MEAEPKIFCDVVDLLAELAPSDFTEEDHGGGRSGADGLAAAAFGGPLLSLCDQLSKVYTPGVSCQSLDELGTKRVGGGNVEISDGDCAAVADEIARSPMVGLPTASLVPLRRAKLTSEIRSISDGNHWNRWTSLIFCIMVVVAVFLSQATEPRTLQHVLAETDVFDRDSCDVRWTMPIFSMRAVF